MRDQKGKYIGMIGAVLVHVAIIALLLFMVITAPEREEESGVQVVMGNAEEALGAVEPSTLVEVDVISQPNEGVTPELPSEQDLITQTEEETVVVEPKKTEEKPKPEKTAAEKAAEAKRLQEEKAEKERKAAAEAANKLVTGAFNKGSEMGSRGQTTGEGIQGTPTGTPSDNSSNAKSGGSSGFDLDGRSLFGGGKLPVPVVNLQEEGKVVVNITVNPGGYVVATSINRLTNTVNPQLRKAAEEAAKKARFNAVNRVDNQMGTITYIFEFK
ncbi:TonB family protein [Bacteroides sp. 519]|uniref:TonB family protein n=1 Tax=Bacteroides sp. 519 TaxID=2302937 RepID=UPI001EF39BC9|nr:TonB family protein [Bacteroides sp. 519]